MHKKYLIIAHPKITSTKIGRIHAAQYSIFEACTDFPWWSDVQWNENETGRLKLNDRDLLYHYFVIKKF